MITNQRRIGDISSAPELVQPEVSFVARVEALFRNWKTFVVVAGVVLILALLWIFATPRKYASEASILVQNARSNVLITSGNTNGPSLVADVSEEQVNSELEILTNSLLDEVVAPGWSTKPLTTYPRDVLKDHEKAVLSLTKRLDTTVPRKTHLLEATIKAESPLEAQQEMQRLIDAFIARHRQIGRPPGSTHFFSTEAERYKNELAVAQGALADFQKKQKLVNLTDQETLLTTKLATADSQRRDTDVQINDLENRTKGDIALLGNLPNRQKTIEHVTPIAGALDQLTTQLITLKNQRTDLLNKYPPTDRAVQEVDAQIAETEKGISQASAPEPRDTSSDVNPTWQQLQTDLTLTRAQLNGLRARRSTLSSQIASLQEQLDSTEQLSPEFSALQHKVTELDTNYQTYLQKRDEADIADAMDRQDLLNFSVVQAPTYSIIPVHPRPLRDTFLAVLTCLILGATAVLMKESVRDTASNAAELERWSSQPVLATIPMMRFSDIESSGRPPEGALARADAPGSFGSFVQPSTRGQGEISGRGGIQE